MLCESFTINNYNYTSINLVFMLEIKNISKSFGSNLVLNNISFSVSKGKIFGILGPNGAGKTTILRIMLCILPPSKGEIYFHDQLLNQDFLNLTGYLPEERGLYPRSSIFNTLVYLGQLKGLTRKKAIENTTYWLDRIDLNNNRNNYLEELSKGNQQKIQFIAAIFHNPTILILDEPFSGFDPVNQSIFRDIIAEIKKDKFIILSTHLMDFAEDLCDEIILINKGEQIISGNLNKLLNSNNNSIYEISFANSIKGTVKDYFSNVKILDVTSNSVKINLKNIEPSEFLKSISGKIDVIEFTKLKLSLNQLFLSLVEHKS